MIDSHSLFLLVSALVSVIALIFLIAVVKLNPVITLFLASLALAIVTGMPPATVIHSFELGVGGVLGHIAIIVATGNHARQDDGRVRSRRPDRPHPHSRLRRKKYSMGDACHRSARRTARILRGSLRAPGSHPVHRGAPHQHTLADGGPAHGRRAVGRARARSPASGRHACRHRLSRRCRAHHLLRPPHRHPHRRRRRPALRPAHRSLRNSVCRKSHGR